MTTFRTITAPDADAFDAAVGAAYAEGWRPVGGVSVACWYERWTNERKGYEESERLACYALLMTREGA